MKNNPERYLAMIRSVQRWGRDSWLPGGLILLSLGMLAGLLLAAAGCSAAAGGASAPVTVQDGNLVPYTVVGIEIPKPLTSKPGDPAEGRKVAVNWLLGNCSVCHKLPIPARFHDMIGPDLDGVGSRYPASVLRLRVVDAKRFNRATLMPAFYKVQGLHLAQGKPLLTAQQVEDVVAYLTTLK
ncbi:MAG: sulfur oxidation c-type cytochrome SoxX [Betaproteobacteria bacterium]|nr:sulfur oxidation c-type cytochrome SoxX [Betaproteobacteria bacterium]